MYSNDITKNLEAKVSDIALSTTLNQKSQEIKLNWTVPNIEKQTGKSIKGINDEYKDWVYTIYRKTDDGQKKEDGKKYKGDFEIIAENCVKTTYTDTTAKNIDVARGTKYTYYVEGTNILLPKDKKISNQSEEQYSTIHGIELSYQEDSTLSDDDYSVIKFTWNEPYYEHKGDVKNWEYTMNFTDKDHNQFTVQKGDTLLKSDQSNNGDITWTVKIRRTKKLEEYTVSVTGTNETRCKNIRSCYANVKFCLSKSTAFKLF